MDTEKIVAILQGKVNKDYTYNFFFFILFALFLFFAIRPNIVTAFSLQKDLQDLKFKHKEAEKKILKIVTYQSVLQSYRDPIASLNSALPTSPKLADIVQNVRDASIESDLTLENLDIQSVEFIKKENEEYALMTIEANISSSSTKGTIDQFMNLLNDQLRLKTIDKLTISKSGLDTYNFTMVLKSYFL